MSKELNGYEGSSSTWFPLPLTTFHRYPHRTSDIAARHIHRYIHVRPEVVGWAPLV